MSTDRFAYIKNWTEADLQQLPRQEDDQHEFKGSSISDSDLGKALSKAASAFWNSGGGMIVAGINKQTGLVDGGIPATVGRQLRREWVDQEIARTQPPGKPLVHIIRPDGPDSPMDPDHVVLVVAFEPSTTAPHMAYDGRYYIRAGAHSEHASHFLVEAIRARRAVQTPIIRAVLRHSARKRDIVELVILVANNATAIDVTLNLEPLPRILADMASDRFPLQIPVIDRNHPFTMDMLVYISIENMPLKLRVEYSDLFGNHHIHEQGINILRDLAPVKIGIDYQEGIRKSIESVSEELKELRNLLEEWKDQGHTPSSLP